MATDTSILPEFHLGDFSDPTLARPNRILKGIYEELDRAATPTDLSDILARIAALEAAPSGGGATTIIQNTVVQIAYAD